MNPIMNLSRMSLENKMIVFTVLVFISLGVGFYLNEKFVEGLIMEYGLIGLFSASFIGSTVFLPVFLEGIFPFLLKSGIDPVIVVGVAAVGSLFGTWVNYGLGFLGSSFIVEKFDHNRIGSARRIMNRYGWIGLFVVIATPLPLPIPVDPITLIPGIARMNFLEFTIVVFAGKLVRYAVWVAFFMGIINGFP